MSNNVETMTRIAANCGANLAYNEGKGYYVEWGNPRNRTYFKVKSPLHENTRLIQFFKFYKLSMQIKEAQKREKLMRDEFDAIISEIPNEIIEKLRVLSKKNTNAFVEYFEIDLW